MTQSVVIDLAVQDLGMEEPPAILAKVAFQPAARGGNCHFTTGNIQIVKKARELILVEQEHAEFTGGRNLNKAKWISSLEEFFRMSESDCGDIEREKLVVDCQDIYQCATCDHFV